MLAARSIPLRALVRQISSNLPRAAPKAKKPVTSRVRKKRQDLPESLLSPSGEPIGPLAAWEGGLKGTSKKCESFSKAELQRTLRVISSNFDNKGIGRKTYVSVCFVRYITL
jgi:hypothetical protein